MNFIYVKFLLETSVSNFHENLLIIDWEISENDALDSW